MHHTIPPARARFRPRLETALLSRLVQDAWAKHQAASLPPDDVVRTGEGICRHLEGLYPLADMRVLAAYGLTRAETAVNVRVHNGTDWSEVVGVELGRSVVVATSFHGLWCGGPHWEGNTPEGRGIKPAYWATMSPKDRQDLMDDQDRRERRRVPRVLEPFFDGILVLRRAFHAEYAQSTAWPTEHRMATGSYPTWGEMAERWPVLGAHLRRVWEPAAKAA